MVSVLKHRAIVQDMLQPGETLRLWIKARRLPMNHQGALALSDRRVLFSGQGGFGQTQEAYPFPVLAGLEQTSDEVRFTAVGVHERFAGKPADIGAFVDALAPEVGSAPVVGGSTLVAEIERLEQLRDAGVLTPAEFAQAKAKLLA